MKRLLQINWVELFSGVGWYLSDLIKFLRKDKNKKAVARIKDLRPYLGDKTSETQIEPIYFLQDLWLAEKIFDINPQKHVDIGSSVKTIALISKAIPTSFVDIRPPDIEIKGLNFIKGSVLDLPFKKDSLESVSSICVLEHIGLGRYGDKIDPFGSEKAIIEIKRVVAPRGSLLVSVPVDSTDKVYFNAHRTFTRDYFLSLFAEEFTLKEEKYIYGKRLLTNYDKSKGFGTGLYHFLKK